MQKKPHILIVDDDREIGDLLGEFLSQHGYDMSLAQNGAEMRQCLSASNVDLILLDIMMPVEDGLLLCKQIRSSSCIPIIMLTAMCEEVETILSLELGADDYVHKPFNPRELLARIRAVLRRTFGNPITHYTLYRFDGWSLNATTRRLVSPENTEVTLSGGEFELLLTFLRTPQHVLSRDTLLDITKNRSANYFDRSIDIQISRLRHKIEKDKNNPLIIKTVRGEGYVLAVCVTKEQVEAAHLRTHTNAGSHDVYPQ